RRRRLGGGARGVPDGQAGPQGRPQGRPIDLRTLSDGGQKAEEIARALADWIAAAERTLEIAIYDVRLPDPLGATVRDALTAAGGSTRRRSRWATRRSGPGSVPAAARSSRTGSRGRSAPPHAGSGSPRR